MCFFQIFLLNKFDYFIVVDNPETIEESLIITKVSLQANISFQNKENLVMFLIRYADDQIEAFNFIFEENNTIIDAKNSSVKVFLNHQII